MGTFLYAAGTDTIFNSEILQPKMGTVTFSSPRKWEIQTFCHLGETVLLTSGCVFNIQMMPELIG